MGGGKATFSGTDFQARVTAYLAVAALVRNPLAWLEIGRPAIPISVACETGGPGDDISVELQGTETTIEVQAKSGLRNDARLLDTFKTIAERLPASNPNLRVTLAVDAGRTSRTITNDLRQDLIRIKQGRTDDLKDVTKRLRESLDDADAVLSRVDIVELDLESETASHLENCLIALRQLVGDPHAESAWSILVAEANVLARNKGRRDVDQLLALLGAKGIALAARDGGRAVDPDDQSRTAAFTEVALEGGSTADLEKTKWDARIGLSKQLLDAGKDRAALSLLGGLKNEIDEAGATPSIRTRYWNNLGVAQMQTGSLDEAKASFFKALDYDDSDRSALANLANLHLLANDWKQSLQFADLLISIEPESVFAWSARVVATHHLGFENTPPDEVANQPAYLTALAQVRFAEHAWEEAVDLLRRALKAGPRNTDRLSMLAQAISNVAHKTPHLEHSAEFEEVDRITTEAIEGLTKTEQSVKLARAHILRGMARHSRGKTDEAREDFTEATGLDDDPWLPAYHQAGIELDVGNSQAALDLLNAVKGEPPASVMVLKAEALVELNRAAEARPLLEQALNNAADAEDETETLIRAAAIAVDAGELDVSEVALQRVQSPADEWRVNLVRARVCVKRGNHENALAAFLKSAEAAPDPGARSGIQFEHASHLATLGRFGDAVALYERSGAPDGPDSRRELYARALLADDRLTKVDALLETILSRDGTRPKWAFELAARIAYRREDFDQAASLLREMWSSDEGDLAIGLPFASALIKAKNLDEASKVVDRLSAETTDCSAVQLIQLAELRHLTGGGDAVLQLAYHAVRAEPANADVQLAYVNLFLRRERDGENLEVTIVAAGTHVTLEGPGGETLEYLILDEENLDIRRGEVSPSDESVSDLIGLKAGDRVTRRPGALSEEEYTIKEIKHRFVHAFQDIFLGFRRRFPNNIALQSFKISEEPTVADFAPMVANLNDRSEMVDQAHQLHADHLMPLGMVAVLLGSSVREVMTTWSSGKGNRIMAEWGSIHEVEGSVDAASQSGPIVLSMSALFTAELLGILEILASHGGELIVPTSLQEEVENDRAKLEPHVDDGLNTLVKVGDTITIHSTPAVDVRRAVEQLSELCKWIEDKCEVRTRPIGSLSRKNDELRDKLGASSFDALVLADETEGIIYADDLGLRRLAAGEFDRRSFSTYALLRAAGSVEHIAPAERDRLFVKLVERNYFNIPITGELLFNCLEANGYSIGAPFLELMERVGDKEVNLDSALRVIADLLRRLALSTFGYGQLKAVCQVGLEYLSGTHDPVLAAKGLNVMARGFLRFLPDAQEVVRGAIALFLNTKLLGL